MNRKLSLSRNVSKFKFKICSAIAPVLPCVQHKLCWTHCPVDRQYAESRPRKALPRRRISLFSAPRKALPSREPGHSAAWRLNRSDFDLINLSNSVRVTLLEFINHTLAEQILAVRPFSRLPLNRSPVCRIAQRMWSAGCMPMISSFLIDFAVRIGGISTQADGQQIERVPFDVSKPPVRGQKCPAVRHRSMVMNLLDWLFWAEKTWSLDNMDMFKNIFKNSLDSVQSLDSNGHFSNPKSFSGHFTRGER